MTKTEDAGGAAEIEQPKVGKHDALVDEWFAEHFPNSPVSRDTAAYNHAQQAKDILKKRLSSI